MHSLYKQIKHTKGLFWRVVKTYQIKDFVEVLQMVKVENPITVAYLEGIDYQQWAHAHLSDIQYNIIIINIVELFNA